MELLDPLTGPLTRTLEMGSDGPTGDVGSAFPIRNGIVYFYLGAARIGNCLTHRTMPALVHTLSKRTGKLGEAPQRFLFKGHSHLRGVFFLGLQDAFSIVLCP